jgi:hypothetical protein
VSGKIDQAVAQVNARKAKQPVLLREARVRVTQDPLIVRGSGELVITRAEDADPTVASLLLFDPTIGAFRPVLLPPGKSFELVERRQGPSLWTPGRPS